MEFGYNNKLIKKEERMKIKVWNLLKESLPNFKAKWCKCKDGNFEDEIRYMDDDSCFCGVKKHHTHRIKCGHITQVG